MCVRVFSVLHGATYHKKYLNTVANIIGDPNSCPKGKGGVMTVSRGPYETHGLFHPQTTVRIFWVQNRDRLGFLSAHSYMRFGLEVGWTPHAFHRQAVEECSRTLQSNGCRSRWNVIEPRQNTQKPLPSAHALPAIRLAS